jgi:pyruvate/oxaloacetate carboxyltransferase
VPIEIHARCNTGLAPLAYLEAIKIGTDLVHAAVSPLASASSLPFIENILKNTRRLGYLTNIDEDALKVFCDHFMKETIECGVEQGRRLEHDAFHFEDQVPGRMMGTLRDQLTELGMQGRLEEFLKRCLKFAGSWVIRLWQRPTHKSWVPKQYSTLPDGERYKIVSDEVIKCALGYLWGPDGAETEK